MIFHKEVRKLLEAKGWLGAKSPSGLLVGWREFVQECEDGYEMSIYEYDNDLSIRDAIEDVLCAKHVRGHSDFLKFEQRVFEIDEIFRQLLSDKFYRVDKTKWWKRGLLSRAGLEYLDDINKRYKIEIPRE